MASSTVHLAVINELQKRHRFKDPDRLRTGSVLVDWGDKSKAHLMKLLDNGARKVYDIDSFRKRFGELMAEDDLYLGYYLHLVQDLLYRHFVYAEHGWVPSPENVKKLHRDYSIVNNYVIPKYVLKNDIVIPEGFENEAINRLCCFDTQKMLKDLHYYFTLHEDGEIFFFTKEMTDDYIANAAELCIKELESLKNGKTSIDILKYAWDNHTYNESK